MPHADGLFIDGVEVQPLLETFEIQQTSNGIDTLDADIDEKDDVARLALDSEVIYYEAGEPVFGGYILGLSEKEFTGVATDDIVTHVEASAYGVLTRRRVINASRPAESLEDRVTFFQSLLSTYGITLDGAQVTGPTLEAKQYVDVVLQEALADTTTETSNLGTPFYPKISPAKVFGFYEAGTVPAPFGDLTDGDTRLVGDIQVDQTRDDGYANWLKVVGSTQHASPVTDVFIGDGAEDTFELNAWPDTGLPNRGVVVYDDGVNPPVSETMGTAPATWIYDAATNTIQDTGAGVGGYRNSPPDAGTTITIVYDGTYAIEAIAEDVPDQAAPPTGHGLWEAVERWESITTKAEAQAKADARLIERMTVGEKTIRWKTFDPGVAIGMDHDVTSAKRDISGPFLITHLTMRYEEGRAPVGAGDALLREVTAVGGTVIQGGWEKVIKDWDTDTTGGGVITGSGDGGTAGLGILSGSGHPQSVVTATVGRIYLDLDTGFLYRKMAGSGNTGWYYFHIPGAGGGLGPQWTSLSASVIASGAPNFDGSGFGAPVVTNMQAAVAFGNTWYNPAVTNTSTGTRGGWESGAETIPWFDFDFDFTCQFRTHTTLVDGRIFIGIKAGTITNSDTLPGKGLAFRYSQGTDSGWMGVKHDGSTQSLTAQVAAIAVSTNYHLRIRFLRATNTVYFSVNDGAEVSSTANVPAAGTNACAFYYIYNKNATPQNLPFRHAGMTYPGVAA